MKFLLFCLNFHGTPKISLQHILPLKIWNFYAFASIFTARRKFPCNISYPLRFGISMLLPQFSRHSKISLQHTLPPKIWDFYGFASIFTALRKFPCNIYYPLIFGIFRSRPAFGWPRITLVTIRYKQQKVQKRNKRIPFLKITALLRYQLLFVNDGEIVQEKDK